MNLSEFSFKKSFGQNFIKEEKIVEKIKNVSDIEDGSLVIEVGPGAGSLTKKLVHGNYQVLAYEIDERLKEHLVSTFGKYDNIEFIFDDFLKRDIKKDIEKYHYSKIYLVANLPYYITTPIIEKVIKEIDVYKMVIMVQKEVADRFSAKVGTKEYSSITVFLNYQFDVKREFIVSRNCFIPKPNVDSAVVSFTKKEIEVPVLNKEKFERLIRDSFQFKRKTLRNNLRSYPLEKIEEVLKKYGHDLSTRAEAISTLEFIEISNYLEK